MKWITLVLCAAVAMILLACGEATRTTNSPAPSAAQPTATATATPDELAAARTNFQKTCVACHGETGEGGTKQIEGKTLKVPSFKAAHALKDSDKEFSEQIHEGGDGMPAFKDKLSAQEIADLVKFVRKEFQGK
jgi:mono/diheme cytochrome c family protein